MANFIKVELIDLENDPETVFLNVDQIISIQEIDCEYLGEYTKVNVSGSFYDVNEKLLDFLRRI